MLKVSNENLAGKNTFGFFFRFARLVAVLAIAALLVQPLAVLADGTTADTPAAAVTPSPTPTPTALTGNGLVADDTTASPTPTDIATPTPTPTDVINNDPMPDDSTTTPTATPTPTEAPTVTPTSTPTPSPVLVINNCQDAADGTGQCPAPSPTPTATGTPPTNCDSSISSNATTTDGCITSPADPDSSTSAADSTTTLDLLNDNNLNATTTATSTANSGLNNTTANGDLNFATTTTGDVNIYANVLTVANINLVNSQIEQINNNFNQLAASLYLNQPELTPGQRTQDLVSPICGSSGLSCQSITTFKLTNQNSANLDNNVNVSGNSGGNQQTAGGDAAEGSISTGNVNAVVNVLNIVNANAVNSTWTIVTFNVFGNWQGDLVMPSELYFTDAMSVGTNLNNDVSQVQQVMLNANNTNQSGISNNVTVQTDSGGNVVASVPDAKGNSGDVNDASITTGTSTAESDVQNLTNITLYNSEWFLGLVNIMGKWSGNIYSLPSAVAVNYEPNGFEFVSSSNPAAQAQLMAELQPTNATSSPDGTAAPANPDGMGPADSSNQQNLATNPGATTTDATTVDLVNSNQAVINNNITVDAITGLNNITSVGGDVDNNSITTGSATALANVLNFANANLVDSDLYVGLVNIYGDWQGNIVFGYPDLSASQSAAQSQVPAGVGARLNINANFANQGDGSMAGSQLEWKFDPTLFSLTGVQASTTDASIATSSYQTLAPGDVQVALGSLAPNQTGNASFLLQTLTDQTNGPADSFFARIFGSGPEINLTNNQNTLNLTPATGRPVSTGGNNGGSSSGGGSSGGGSSSSSGGGNSGGGLPGNNSGSSGGSSNNNGNGSAGGGGGAQSGAAVIGVAPNLLHIYKSNTAGGSVKPGTTVHFTVTIDNDGNNTLHSLAAYDTMQGPDGLTVSSRTYPVPDMVSRARFEINYDLAIAPTAAPGVYTNSVYARGLNDALQTVTTQTTALSSFAVVNSGASAGQGKAFTITNSPNATTTKAFVAPGLLNTAAVGTASSNIMSLLTMDGGMVGQILGAVCIQPGFGANLKPGSKNKEVQALQVYLNDNGFVLTRSGPGSSGHETPYFGGLLKAALAKFQKLNGLKERGVFGADTRTFLNNLLNTSGAAFCPAPASVVKASVPKSTKLTVKARPVKK